MFYRKWKDPGSDWEEVSEEDARNALSGNYRDVDLAIEGMKAGGECPHNVRRLRVV
jgi:hypothetical protein